MNPLPRFPGHARKNDALFMYGAGQPMPFVRVYEQPQIEIVCGPSCRRNDEIRLDRCEADGVSVVERRNGGGTVVLGPGMVITIIVGQRRGDSAAACFNTIHDAMIALLRDAGIHNVVRNGISDLSINERKILGSSLYLGTRPPCYYYQSSLLVAPDLMLFEHYLHHPPREPGYRKRRPHREFCTSLVQEGCPLSAHAVAELFAARLAGYLSDVRVKE